MHRLTVYISVEGRHGTTKIYSLWSDKYSENKYLSEMPSVSVCWSHERVSFKMRLVGHKVHFAVSFAIVSGCHYSKICLQITVTLIWLYYKTAVVSHLMVESLKRKLMWCTKTIHGRSPAINADRGNSKTRHQLKIKDRKDIWGKIKDQTIYITQQ